MLRAQVTHDEIRRCDQRAERGEQGCSEHDDEHERDQNGGRWDEQEYQEQPRPEEEGDGRPEIGRRADQRYRRAERFRPGQATWVRVAARFVGGLLENDGGSHFRAQDALLPVGVVVADWLSQSSKRVGAMRASSPGVRGLWSNSAPKYRPRTSAVTSRRSSLACRTRRTSSSRWNASGPASSTMSSSGEPTATSARALAMSSAASGWTSAAGTRRAAASGPDWPIWTVDSKH